jgi:hypothetical protein
MIDYGSISGTIRLPKLTDMVLLATTMHVPRNIVYLGVKAALRIKLRLDCTYFFSPANHRGVYHAEKTFLL